MPRLILLPGTPEAREIALKPGINTVGRGEANDITIADPSVSTSHCQVILSDGTVQLHDLGSTNGTFVNGVQINETTVQPGQRIQLGTVELQVAEDGAAAFSSHAVSPASTATPRLTIGATPPGPVRLTFAHAAVEAPVAATGPVEAPPVVPVAAPANAPCKYHPRTLARWICTNCHKTYCDLCVSARPGAGAGQMFCRSCGGLAAPLQVIITAPEPKSFFKELPRAIGYPFRGTGIMMLIAATIVFAVLDFISAGILGLLMKAVALGYLFSYVQNIIHSTAADEDRLPELPGMDDVLGGFFRLAGTVLISFGPALALAYVAIAHEQPLAGIALIPAIVFGCLYFPMAFLAVAIKDNTMAANPLVVIPSILKVPLEYLVTAILVGGVFGIRLLGNAVSSGMAGQSLMTTSMTEMFLLFGLRALWAFVSVYLLTVTMRILGLLYLTKRDKLDW